MTSEKDKYLTDQYRKESDEKVPSFLDQQILQQAKAEIEESAPPQPSEASKTHRAKWTQWYATAAVFIIGIGLVTFMQREAPDEIALSKPDTLAIDSLPESKQREEVALLEDSIQSEIAHDEMRGMPMTQTLDALPSINQLAESELSIKPERTFSAMSSPAAVAKRSIAKPEATHIETDHALSLDIESPDSYTVSNNKKASFEVSLTNLTASSIKILIKAKTQDEWIQLEKNKAEVTLAPKQKFIHTVTFSVSSDSFIDNAGMIALEIQNENEEQIEKSVRIILNPTN